MGYRERKPGVVVDGAKVRLDGMKTIDTNLGATVNYGSPTDKITQAEMTDLISKVEDMISDYNQTLEKASDELNDLVDAEKKLKKMSLRVLKGAVAQFGDDSSQVEVLGGVRVSERKKPVRKKKAA
jgi:hypothetical protein